MRLTTIPLLTTALFMSLLAQRAQGDVVFTSLASFTGQYGPNPGVINWGRQGAMVQGGDGNFYGITENGGPISIGAMFVGSVGTVFKMTPNGAFTTLHIFNTVTNASGENIDGCAPSGNLIKGADGNLYGTTAGCGRYGFGTVFQLTTNEILNTLYSFGNNVGNDPQFGLTNNAGGYPHSGLVQGSDGNFYGTTTYFGAYSSGTVFRLSPGGALTTLHSFSDDDMVYRARPWGELVEGRDGNFYGTTEYGGTNGSYGTIFQITPSGAFTTLHAFTGGADGAYLKAGLKLGCDGNLYGVTVAGGAYGNGTVFQIKTNGTLTTLHAFTGGADGSYPVAGLTSGSDGNFYGTASVGGANGGHGTVFQITTNGVFTTLHSFSGADGGGTTAALTQSSDSHFYGTTSWNGTSTNEFGTIFRIIIPPAFQTIMKTNGSIAFTWSAMPNQICQVQYKTDLSSTNWLNLGNPITATNSTVTASDSIGTEAQRFYRIKLLP